MQNVVNDDTLPNYVAIKYAVSFVVCDWSRTS